MENVKKLKVSQMEKFILSAINVQMAANQNGHSVSTLWISGSPGIGKTWSVANICRKNDFGLAAKYVATMMLEQITGLPKALNKVGDEETEWTKPQLFSLKNLEVVPSNNERPIILFLDDAHLCNKSIQSYLFQLLTYRSIHSHKLPKNVVIIMAGNRSSDKAGFQQILAPISNRLYFLDIDSDVDDWVENFASSNGVRTDIILFLKNNPIHFQNQPIESGAWASPRSWTYASLMLDQFESESAIDIDTMTRIVSGHVGIEAATEYVKYRELMIKWESHLILDGLKEIPKTNNKMESYTLMSACISELMTRYRKNSYVINDHLNKNIDILGKIFENMMSHSKEIIPLGLKVFLMGEGESTNSKSVLVKKLLNNKELVDMILSIIN